MSGAGRAPLPRSPRGQAPKPMVAGVASHGHTATERLMPPTPLLPQTARFPSPQPHGGRPRESTCTARVGGRGAGGAEKGGRGEQTRDPSVGRGGGHHTPRRGPTTPGPEARAPGTGGLRAQGERGGLGGSGRAPCAGDWGAQGKGETLLGAKPDGEAGRRRRLPRGERGPGLPATWAPRRPRLSPAKVTAQTR